MIMKTSIYEAIFDAYLSIWVVLSVANEIFDSLSDRFMVKRMPMGSFFEEQFSFAKIFNGLEYDDTEVGLITAIMIMNPGTK